MELVALELKIISTPASQLYLEMVIEAKISFKKTCIMLATKHPSREWFWAKVVRPWKFLDLVAHDPGSS